MNKSSQRENSGNGSSMKKKAYRQKPIKKIKATKTGQDTTTNSGISTLIKQGESETLEFKSSFNDEAIESIGAFSNASGGQVLIGIDDHGNPSGFQIGKKTIEDIVNRIQSATEPRLHPLVRQEKYRNEDVVLITVPQSIGAPTSIRGRYFRRVGRTNQRISSDEVVRRVVVNSRITWDQIAEPEFTYSMLDEKQIRNFVQLMRNAKRVAIPVLDSKSATLQLILEKTQLLVDGKPTRAAILLFGKRPDRVAATSFIKIGRFRSPSHILDEREIGGTLFDQIEGTMNWLEQHLQAEIILTGKPARDLKWEYPLEAVREAVVNSICHRDYTVSASTQIRLYDDRLIIWNIGPLQAPLSTKQLFQDPHPSIQRNPLIATALYNAGMIERWGSGTANIAKNMKESGLPKPRFISNSTGGFEVILSKPPLLADELKEHERSKRQVETLRICQQRGGITNREYQRYFNVSTRTATRELGRLVKKGLLITQGKGRGLRYIVRLSR